MFEVGGFIPSTNTNKYPYVQWFTAAGENDIWQTWRKPPGVTWIWIMAIGAGSGGGGGAANIAASTAGGGGGGSSGAVGIYMYPAVLLPDTLYITCPPGGTGGPGKAAGSAGSGTAGGTAGRHTEVLCYPIQNPIGFGVVARGVSSSVAGAGGTTAAGGTGGSAPTAGTTPIGQEQIGMFRTINGHAGSNGGNTGVGGNSTPPVSAWPNGGAGGAGKQAAQAAGGSVLAVTGVPMPQISGGAAGGGAGEYGQVWNSDTWRWWSSGGAGGGSNTSGAGGRGGDAAIGGGGGGGGGGMDSSGGGDGGNGGSGAVIIVCS